MKTKNIILDTNVWYKIADEDNLELLNYLKEKGRLCVTPITYIELSAEIIDEKKYHKMKNRAFVIATYADRYLDHPEVKLASYFGYECQSLCNWKEAFKTLYKAKSYDELISKDYYEDKDDEVLRKFDKDNAKNWRDQHYKHFELSLINIKKIVEHENKKVLKKNTIEMLNYYDSDEFYKVIVDSQHEKAYEAYSSTVINTIRKKKKKAYFNIGHDKLSRYIKIYIAYCKYFLREYANPKFNDLGDFELFIYLQNKNWLYATSDKRWVTLGKQVCCENMIDITTFRKTTTPAKLLQNQD